MFEDVEAENACLAGVFEHGRDAYIDCVEFINAEALSLDLNQVIWSCMEDHYESGEDRRLDYPSLLSVAKRKGLSRILDKTGSREHVRDLMDLRVELGTVRSEAAKLLKLRIGRELHERLKSARDDLSNIDGSETLNQIIGLAENPIFEYSSKLNSDGHDTQEISVGMREWWRDILENPRENVGIPTPFSKFNSLIGGGFRRRGISMLGGAYKSGKSFFCDNVALHVAGTLGIPILNLDTELSDEEHWARIIAHITNIPADKIERGDVNPDEAGMVEKAISWVESIPYYYRSVIDETFEEQIAAMRRWVVKTVGVDDEGVRNDCLVIYDYLQMTDPREFGGGKFAEYQILGFQMVALTRLAKRYDVPIFSLVQLNREGIVAGSDRIMWKCANFAFIHRKEEEEISKHGKHNGTLWLTSKVARHGPGGSGKHDDISIIFDGATAKMVEGPTRGELEKGLKPSIQKGFEVEENDEDEF